MEVRQSPVSLRHVHENDFQGQTLLRMFYGASQSAHNFHALGKHHLSGLLCTEAEKEYSENNR